MAEKTINLPKTVGGWTLSAPVRTIDSSTIFGYMNGAGELYLAYGFDRLEVCEYTAAHQEGILVEVYRMNSSNDAFGLLSTDWDGEPVAALSDPSYQAPLAVARARALYGGGLLRVWADHIYARVMAYRETPESKEAVLALGQAIAANQKPSAEPALLQALPRAIGSDWKMREDRIAYFRSHLVLNSLYYLSHQNILNLDHSSETVTAPYENITDAGSSKRVQALCVRYATARQAQKALDNFHNAYLQDHQKGFGPNAINTHSNFFNIEDGWMGYTLNETCLAAVFECPNRESAQMIIQRIACISVTKENVHGN